MDADPPPASAAGAEAGALADAAAQTGPPKSVRVHFDDGPEVGFPFSVDDDDFRDDAFWRYEECHGVKPKAKIVFGDGAALFIAALPSAATGVLVDGDGDSHKYEAVRPPEPSADVAALAVAPEESSVRRRRRRAPSDSDDDYKEEGVGKASSDSDYAGKPQQKRRKPQRRRLRPQRSVKAPEASEQSELGEPATAASPVRGDDLFGDGPQLGEAGTSQAQASTEAAAAPKAPVEV